jgi:hypothetical protein
MSIGEVAAELASAANNVERVRRSVVTEARRMEAAREVAERAVRGSLRPEPASLLARWEAAARQANQAADLLHTGWQAIRAYLEKIDVPGTPLFEPIKTGTELLEENETSPSSPRALQRALTRGVGDLQKSTKVAVKAIELTVRKPTGTTVNQPRSAFRPAEPVQDVQPDTAAGAALIATIAFTGAIAWSRERRRRKRQERDNDD